MSIGKESFGIFDVILSHHPNVNARNNEGETALYCVVSKALGRERNKYLKRLIENNPPCNMQIRYKNGKTILHCAVENQDVNEESVKLIIDESGLDVDVEDDNGDTPLHLATLKKANDKIIQLLINLGCDPTQPNKTGRTPFSMADSKMAPKISEWMNEPEAIQSREQRKIDKQKLLENEMKNRRELRDEKLQEKESPSKTIKNKRSKLLAMTLGNGTLRSAQKDFTTSPVTDPNLRSKKFKRVEARPWGGSKETAMFQREIRLRIRKFKASVKDELEQIHESIKELKKEITGESDNKDFENSETEPDSTSEHESANTSHSQVNNDAIEIQSNNEQSQSFDNDQNQVEVANENYNDNENENENMNTQENQEQLNEDLSQNSQGSMEVPAGNEEEINLDQEDQEAASAKEENKEQNTDSELNQLLNEDNNSPKNSSFDIDNIDQL